MGSELTLVDFIIIGIFAISVLISIFRGFTKEVVTLLAWVLATYLAINYGPKVGEIFSFVQTIIIKNLLGGALIFIAIVIMGAIVNFAVSKIIKYSGMWLLDSLGGFAFGLVRATALMLILVGVLMSTTIKEQVWWQKSSFLPKLEVMCTNLYDKMPVKWQQFIIEQKQNWSL